MDTLEEATQLLTSDGGGGGDSSEVTIADIANYINSFPLSSLGKGRVMQQVSMIPQIITKLFQSTSSFLLQTYACDGFEAAFLLQSAEGGSLCENGKEDHPCCKLEKAARNSMRFVLRLMKYGDILENRYVLCYLISNVKYW